MQEILKSISLKMIEIGEYKYSNAQIKSKWLGNKPASIEEIISTEKRIKVSLPQDYREFMMISNGFRQFNNVEPTFHPLNEIDFLKKINPELIKIWKETGNVEIGEILESSILIGGKNEEQLFLIIPPDSKKASWRFWKFAAWMSGEEPHENLS